VIVHDDQEHLLRLARKGDLLRSRPLPEGIADPEGAKPGEVAVSRQQPADAVFDAERGDAPSGIKFPGARDRLSLAAGRVNARRRSS